MLTATQLDALRAFVRDLISTVEGEYGTGDSGTVRAFVEVQYRYHAGTAAERAALVENVTAALAALGIDPAAPSIFYPGA